MTCCKLSENDTVRDFILNSQAPIYTAIKLTEMYREEALRLKDKSQDFIEIAEYCEVRGMKEHCLKIGCHFLYSGLISYIH